MRITKCDICKKTIPSGSKSELLQLAYNGVKTFDSFELCANCSKPIIKILLDKKLLKIENKKKMKNNKEITLSAIAELIEASAKKTSESLEAKIEASAKKTSESLEAKIEASAKKTIETLESKIEKSAESLATMTQQQFLELGEKINIIEEKINHIEGEIIKKVDTIEYNTIDHRIEKLEEKFA
jgi:flagellar biosynthesis GTPase FlhF